MSFEQFFDENKKIQESLLDYIDDETNMEEKYQNLEFLFDDINIHSNRYKIKLLLNLISKISDNHHRLPNFFYKIDRILHLFSEDMKKYFTNSELFDIFKSNKRLILFLLEEKIMIMNEDIVKIIITKKYLDANYPQYFSPEIQPFINEKWFPKCPTKNDIYDNIKKLKLQGNTQLLINYYELLYFGATKNNNSLNQWVEEITKELPADFYQKRKMGENDDSICKIIQKDSIEEFIILIEKNLYSVASTIKPSIYETNYLLLNNKDITLIEYAVFWGSIQIFNYLRKNGAELKPSLWLYSIHGQNEEIIHLLEDAKILPIINKDEISENKKENNEENVISFKKIFEESIKCHHIDVTNYIQYNYLQNEKSLSNDTLIYSFKYYNFIFIQYNINIETLFFYSCYNDYYLLVELLLKKMDIDINKKIIFIVFFHSIFNYEL